MMPFVPLSRPAADDTAVLLARLGAGDAAAFDVLYRREAGAVYRYALAMAGDAADATHDAFVALAARPSGFDPARGALGAYRAGIARHALLALRHLRDDRRRPRGRRRRQGRRVARRPAGAAPGPRRAVGARSASCRGRSARRSCWWACRSGRMPRPPRCRLRTQHLAHAAAPRAAAAGRAARRTGAGAFDMNDTTANHQGNPAMPLADLLRDAAQGLSQVQPPAALRERIVARAVTRRGPARRRNALPAEPRAPRRTRPGVDETNG
jgi:hypothetical protein